MVWKVIGILLVYLMIFFGFIYVFGNVNVEPVSLEANYLEPESDSIIEYGSVPVFLENLRFNHNLISYYIDDSCDSKRTGEMIEAFNIFSDKIKIISFFEVESDADILVGCSDEFIGMGSNLFAAGEGGPSRIINTSLFKIIEEGEVILYNGNDCDYPIVALHELGHVFGFDHSDDPKNIMYNVSSCNQRMSQDMIDLMMELYSMEALADLRIDNLEASLRGRYLNFNISILNEGMIGVENVTLSILGDGNILEDIEVGEIDVGYGRVLRVENMRISSGVDVLKFVLDRNDLINEFFEDNNFAEVLV